MCEFDHMITHAYGFDPLRIFVERDNDRIKTLCKCIVRIRVTNMIDLQLILFVMYMME